MDYFRIQSRIIHTPLFVRASVAAKGAWLQLHDFCARQENGGKIEGAGSFDDRMWLISAGVTAEEVGVAVEAGLAEEFDDDSLVLVGYDEIGERALHASRAAGRKGSAKRWGNANASSPPKEGPNKPPYIAPLSGTPKAPLVPITHHSIPDQTTQVQTIPGDPCSAEEPGNWGSLARDLIDAYPHRVDEDGIEDRPSEYELEIELATAYGDESRKGAGWSPGGFGEAMVSAARALAKVRTGKGRKTGKGLKGWIRAKGWTVPVTRAKGQEETTGAAMSRSERERRERRRLNDEARGLAPIGDSIRDIADRSTP